MTSIDTADVVASSKTHALDRDSTGRLWALLWQTTDDRFELWYSDDDGSTWTENTAARLSFTPTESSPWFSFQIDADDHGHIVYGHNVINKGATVHRRMASMSTTSTWSGSTSFTSGITAGDFVVFREGTGWRLWLFATDGVQAGLYSLTITSGGTVATSTNIIVDITSISGVPSIALHHTGDPKIVKGGTPHLFCTYQQGGSAGLKFFKVAWSAGTWTKGTNRSIANNLATHHGIAFDGTRALITYVVSGDTFPTVAERDAADTTTTVRTPGALSDGTINTAGATYDSEGDIHLFAIGATSADVKRTVYDRSAGTWSSWSTVATATAANMSTKRGYSSRHVEVLYTDTGSMHHAAVRLNLAPTAPSWVTVSGVADVDETLLLDWTFEDPDAVFGDAQTAYALSRQIGAGSVEYWNTTTWVGTESKNTTATTEVTLAAAWGVESADNHVYKVKTWDADDTEGVYGDALTITPSEQVNPTITAPTAAQVLDTASVTITHTVSQQSAQRHRVLTDPGNVVIHDTGWVTTATASSTVVSGLSNSTSYTAEVTTKNSEGLASDAIEQDFSTSFTEPAIPTAPTPTVDNTNHTLTYTVTNPTPVGAEPDVLSNEVWLTTTSGTDAYLPSTTTTRVADDVAENGTYVFRSPASGVEYRAYVVAIGDNGTTSTSAAID